MHFSVYQQHVREAKHKCAISFKLQRRATQRFIPWMNQILNESSESVIQPVHSDALRPNVHNIHPICPK